MHRSHWIQGAIPAALFSLIPARLFAAETDIGIGLLSAIVDNIPDMSVGQWLLVTLMAGVGVSMLSIGSAAGVALMGQAQGMYRFFTHLRWTSAVMAGYVASITMYIWINAARI